ncbi:MAG: SHOCT domain-containing protein [Actinomycetota bacterium]
MILPVLFLIAIVVGIILVARAFSARPRGARGLPGGSGRRDALGILEERFARGEIDAEEFEERRRALHS